MTDSTSTTQQTQSSQSQPWAAALPLVNNLISKYGNQSTDVTGQQSTALANLNQATSNLPNFVPQASTAISNLFNTNTAPQVGMLQTAYDTQKANLSPIASGSTNPYDTPGFSDAIKTAIADTTNAVKGVYAGSGRDPSGAGSFAQSLGRGITQGISPTIASQFNANVGNLMNANSALMSGANNTATGINALNQQGLTNGVAGLTAAGSIPGLATGGGLAQLGAANAAYSLPYANLSALLQPSTALAGLGTTSSGTSQGTQTSTPSLMSSLSQGTQLGGSWLSGLGSLMALSDRRAKTDVRKVGALHDGQNVYSFRYKGSPKTEIGLMAQEVERRDPDAVREIGGMKHVDYGRALAPAARVGALARAA
jgi:hypothetical protein